MIADIMKDPESQDVKIMRYGSKTIYLVCLISMCVIWQGCRPQAESNVKDCLSNAPLSPHQAKLLQTAFEIATAIPVHPHIKDRSLAQEQVVTTCIALKQPQRALSYTQQIENWRQGLCYGQLAYTCAQQGARQEAQNYIIQASEIADNTEDWRQDRIRAWIARTLLFLGQTDQAQTMSQDLLDSEAGQVTQAQAEMSSMEDFNTQIEALDTLVATGEYEKTCNALRAYVKLLDRFYTDQKKRDQIQAKIPVSWEKIPIFVRIELLIDQMEVAQDHNDLDTARQCLQQAYTFMEDYRWRPEERLPLMAKLIKWRFRLGQEQEAKNDAEAALALFTEQQQRIVNIDKAETLTPLAEAYVVMGEPTKALQVYQQAMKGALENPNSRPRAEDIAAICCSMARQGIEPDEALWKRLGEIQAGLSDPW